MRLTNFHTGKACQQTRTMLMSGRGVSSALERRPPRPDGERAHELRQDIATLPELLRDTGYRTYMAGKWDLGMSPEKRPVARGFDRSFALLEASSSHFAEYFWSEQSWYQEDDRPLDLDDLPEDFYSTTAYTDKMLEYLRTHDDGDGPWFSYIAYTTPHWPLQVPDDWLDRHAGKYDEGYDVLRRRRYAAAVDKGVIPEGADLDGYQPTALPWTDLPAEHRRRSVRAQEIYASMVETLDLEAGRIVRFLEDSGQLDNTVVIFFSDNGASDKEFGLRDGPSGMPPHFDALLAKRDNAYDNFGRRGSFMDRGRGFAEAATAPLKYIKSTFTEGGIRNAAFVRYPAAVAKGGIDGEFITVIDLLPTLLEIAGTEHPGAVDYNGRRVQPIIGRSFWPYLRGASESVHDADDVAGWSQGDLGAIIRGRYKLTNQPPPGTRIDAPPPWRLYDLVADPGETTDVSSQHPGLAVELLTIWKRDWR